MSKIIDDRINLLDSMINDQFFEEWVDCEVNGFSMIGIDYSLLRRFFIESMEIVERGSKS